MTRIHAEYGNGEFSIDAVGHATGSQEACTGISALLYALAGWLENQTGEAEALNVKLDPGDAEIRFRGGKTAEAIMDMTVIGLQTIEKTVGKETVSVEIIER